MAPRFAPVAQLDRVPGYEPGGRGFNSCRARQISQGCARQPFFLAGEREIACTKKKVIGLLFSQRGIEMSRNMLHRLVPTYALMFALWLVSFSVDAADTIDIVSPNKGEVISSQNVPVTLRFMDAIDPASFHARLNGRDINVQFTLSSSGASATLTPADGLRIKEPGREKKSGNDRNKAVSNQLQIFAKLADRAGNGRPETRHVHAHVHFYVKANGGGSQTQVTATITPSGGELTLSGYGTATFPSGAFAINQQVKLALSSDASIADNFNTTTVMADPGPRAVNELTINTGLVQPATDIGVSLTVPADILTSMPVGYEPVLFVLLPQGGGDVMYHFELLYPNYDSVTRILSATLPSWSFGSDLTADKSYQTTIIVGTSKIRPSVSLLPNEVGFSNVALGNDACTVRPDPHKTLAPPIDGKLDVSSHFAPRILNGKVQGHLGVDYHTFNVATLNHDLPNSSVAVGSATVGVPVYSMDEGQIWDVGSQIDPATNSGWGTYIVIKHVDGSKALYGHLTPGSVRKTVHGAKVARGEIIALSGQSGLNLNIVGVGPHLHVEFTPNGKDPQYKVNNLAKVSIEPCVHHDLYVAIKDRPRGVIYRYNLTSDNSVNFSSDTSLFPSFYNGNVLLSWDAIGFNGHAYAVGNHNGSGPATFDGAVFAQFDNPPLNTFGPTSVGVNKLGVYVAENVTYPQTDVLIHQYQFLGGPEIRTLLFRNAHEFGARMGVSDKYICISGGEPRNPDPTLIGGTAILDLNGNELVRLVGGPYGEPCAISNDQLYTVVGQQLSVYGIDGSWLKAIDQYSGQNYVGDIAVTEKNLFVAIPNAQTVLIYRRTVERDADGNIVSDTYALAGQLMIPGPSALFEEVGIGIE